MTRGGRAFPLVVLGLLLALFAAGAPPAQAAAATSVKAQLRPPRIQIGQSTLAVASVGPSGRRGTAELQTYFDGAWRPVRDGRKPVAANNTVSFRVTPKFVGRYRFRIVALPTARHARGVSVTLTLDVVKKVVRVSSAARPSTIELGGTTTVVGTPNPARPNAPVSLQRLQGNAWSTVTTGRVSSRNAISLNHRPATTGQHRYRLVVAADGLHDAGGSPAAVVTVNAPPYTGVTVQDGGAGHATSGSWAVQSAGQSGRSLLTPSQCGGSTTTSTWDATLQRGRYRVEAFIPPGAGEVVQYEVAAVAEVLRPQIDQAATAGTWAVLVPSIGMGDTSRVNLVALAVDGGCAQGAQVGADDVRWVYLGAS